MDVQKRLKDQLGRCALVRGVEQLRTKHVRIATGLQYPDGALIDVFVRFTPLELLSYETSPDDVGLTLSDLGNTTGWLLDVGVRTWQSKKRQQLVDEVLEAYNVRQEGGELVTAVPPGRSLGEYVLRLAQACLRVADLCFTRRASLVAPFADEVEEVLVDAELPYDPDVEVATPYEPVRIDYLVRGRTQSSAVMRVASTNASGARAVLSEVYRRYGALRDTPGWNRTHVAIVDDRRVDLFRPGDLKQLETAATVIGFSERDRLVETLAA